MTERLKLILDIIVRNQHGIRRNVADLRNLRTEVVGSSRPLGTYERHLDSIGRQATQSAGQVAKLRREIQDTNRVVLTNKSGTIIGGSGVGAASGAASGVARSAAAGAAGAGLLSRGLGIGAGVFGGVAVARGAASLVGSLVDVQVQMEGMASTIGVLSERFGLAQDEIAGTEIRLKAMGATTVQARVSMRDFIRAGATQAETVKLVGLAFDSAARQGLTIEDAISRLTRATLKAEPELLDELGIVINLTRVYKAYASALGITNANALTTVQRSRAMVEALVKQSEAGGEFAAQLNTIAGTMVKVDQSGKLVQERLSSIFSGEIKAAADAYLFVVKGIADHLKEIEAQGQSQKFIDQTLPVDRKTRKPIRDISNTGLRLPGGTSTALDNALAIIRLFEGKEAAKARQTKEGQHLQAGSSLQFTDLIPKLVKTYETDLLAIREAEGLAVSKQIEAAIKAADDLRDKQDPIARRLIESLVLDGRSGIGLIRGRRDQTLSRLEGASPGLLAQIRGGFKAQEVRELLRFQESIKPVEFEGTEVQPTVPEFSDNAKRGQQQAINRALQFAQAGQKDRADRAQQIQTIADAEAQIIQLRSRDGSEVRDVLALRLQAARDIFAIEGDMSHLRLETLQAEKDAQVQLAQLERERIDRGRTAAESAFDALISNGSGGFDAFIKSQTLGIGRTITGNAAELFLSNSGTLGIDTLFGGQSKDGKLNKFGKLLQDTPFGTDPADLARDRNTISIDANTLANDRLTNALSIIGSSGVPLSPLSRGVGEGLRLEGLDIFREEQAEASKSNTAIAKETNQLLSKITQTAIFAGAATHGIVGGVRRGGIGGAVQVGGGIAAAASGGLKLLDKLSGLAGPLGIVGLAAPLVAGLFGGQDPLKREHEIQETLKRHAFQLPDSESRHFDTFGRSVDTSNNAIRTVNITINALDSQSVMDRSADITEAVRTGFNADGGAFVGDLRTQFEG